MFKQFSEKKNDILNIQRNIMLIITFVLIGINLLLSVCLLAKNTITILVPFGFNDKISISSNKPQNSYLEAISRDIVNTMLNLTPSNIDYAEKTILSYAHSSSYGVLKNQFEEIKKRIVSKKFSTAFYATTIYPDNSNMLVIIDGMLYTYLGQKEVGREKKKYEIKYNYISGRLSIIGFSEIIEESQINN